MANTNNELEIIGICAGVGVVILLITYFFDSKRKYFLVPNSDNV